MVGTLAVALALVGVAGALAESAARRARWLAIAVVGTLGLAVLPVSLSAKPIETSTYKGRFVGNPEARVSFRVKVRNDGPDRVLFRASNITIYCDDGTTFQENFRRIRLTLHGRIFLGRRLELDPFTQTFYEVSGRLDRAGAAHGDVFWFQDFDHPEELGTPDCSTPAPPPWTAERIR
jgi:hypothetical protein